MILGANAECNEPLCCRASNGPALTPGGGAGRWGDYRKCDTPKRTIDHMLKHIADTHTVRLHLGSFFVIPSFILNEGITKMILANKDSNF